MNIIATIVFLGFVIFVHELGHFLAGKLFNVRAPDFALGFGPKLLGFRRGETLYSLRMFPLGGFVRLVGQDPDDMGQPGDEGRRLWEKPAWQRALVFVAGPLANLLLPIPLYFVIFAITQTGPSTLVGYVIPGMPADRAGVIAGDRITAVDGEDIKLFGELSAIIRDRPAQPVILAIERPGRPAPLEVTVVPSTLVEEDPLGEKTSLGRIGIMPSRQGTTIGVRDPRSLAGQADLRTWDKIVAINGQQVANWNELERVFSAGLASPVSLVIKRPPETTRAGFASPNWAELPMSLEFPATLAPVATPAAVGLETSELYVVQVQPGSPAEQMGLQAGDRITMAGNRETVDEATLDDALQAARRQELIVSWIRNGETHSGRFRLFAQEATSLGKIKVPYYGPGFATYLERTSVEVVSARVSPVKALRLAVFETFDKTIKLVIGIASLFAGAVPLDQVGGPIMLYKISSEAAEQGFNLFINIIAFISLNLGLLNLLPIPILDGGHLALLAVETVKRGPLSPRIRYAANLVGLSLLVLLMGYALTNDIVRYFINV